MAFVRRLEGLGVFRKEREEEEEHTSLALCEVGVADSWIMAWELLG